MMRLSKGVAAAMALLLSILPVPSPWWGGLGRGEAAAQTPITDGAACRIHNQLANGSANVGSGTLIDVASDGERGLVLTCAHLFAEGTGRVAIQFPSGRTHGALLVGIDSDADLAALEIAKPSARAVTVASQFAPAGKLHACGFGSTGEYRCIAGDVIGCSEGRGQQSVRITGAVRSGDSGGGVFDQQGRLTAVVWGESGGVTYASTGRPLAAFLQRVLGSRGERAEGTPPGAGGAACPEGRCPLAAPGVSGGPLASSMPAAGAGGEDGRGGAAAEPPASSRGCDCGGELAAIGARLNELEGRAASSAPGSAAAPTLPTESFGGTARLLATLATAALGVSGPTGWGIIAAASVGGWLIGRRRKKKLRFASHKLREKEKRPELATRNSPLATPAEATAAADVSFPIERDDREARELLRLSQLEGRDPLQDAVAGRLALDRLDALAEGDSDPQQASWADRLRRELRERFNEIAPTKFSANGECGMGNGGYAAF